MKREIFCASQTSTAICMSMDQPSSSSSSTSQLGGKAIDRHNPIIRDQRRSTPISLSITPCTYQSPAISPQPYKLLHKNKKVSNKKSSQKLPKKESDFEEKRKNGGDGVITKDVSKQRWSKSGGDFINVPNSSRYLLSDNNKDIFHDHGGLSSDFDSVQLPVVPLEHKFNSTCSIANQDQSNPTSERPSDQVVELRVSLHCKGCEGKLRKHLSRMEGVRSFNIDFAAKKVTVVGDITPLSVLARVSKVKNAQFWAPPTINAIQNPNIAK